jgi:hypothetical protein
MLKSSLLILLLIKSIFCFAQVPQDTQSQHQIIRYLVNKKGVEIGVIDSLAVYSPFPCLKGKAMNGVINKKPFLGRLETYYDDCTGKWVLIEYYFLGIRTRTRYNPKFPRKKKK